MARTPRPDSAVLAASVQDALVAATATLGTAESLTGGRLAALLTSVPGASRSFRGGIVSYATEVKTDVLGVPLALVEEHGVVSAACARAMAEGARRVLGATYAVSTTGVAGPDRQEDQPPGTVFVAVAGPAGTTVLSLELTGGRAAIQERTCEEALAALLGLLRPEETPLR
ncbi:CinA family protein [Nocardioides sp. cx-173]|uniref:CinA family protein n=1 Tax=Nocardioides sp. cx-173 TaxID=2898796 RepID=UPI001E42F7E5|nr:CinA family protein [Nocardioides sp. cx-173]MCD4525081.1 CinA family protein [Nocardioides sp. cx-173]UGB40214.1 CinA family protein [Nocardioides sp. cx-173]